MHKWNLLKKTAPCILSLAVAATSFPTAVMATDLDSSIVADETEQSDEEEIAEVSDYEAAAGEAADAEEIAAEDRALMRSQRKAQQRIRRKKLPVQTNLQQQKMRQRHLRILMNFRESISMCMQA